MDARSGVAWSAATRREATARGQARRTEHWREARSGGRLGPRIGRFVAAVGGLRVDDRCRHAVEENENRLVCCGLAAVEWMQCQALCHGRACRAVRGVRSGLPVACRRCRRCNGWIENAVCRRNRLRSDRSVLGTHGWRRNRPWMDRIVACGCGAAALVSTRFSVGWCAQRTQSWFICRAKILLVPWRGGWHDICPERSCLVVMARFVVFVAEGLTFWRVS